MQSRNGAKPGRHHRLVKNRLWLYRKKNGYSQKEVATRLGHKSAARICDYERGRRTPSFETALKLSIILRTPIPLLYTNLYAHLERCIKQRTRRINRVRHSDKSPSADSDSNHL